MDGIFDRPNFKEKWFPFLKEEETQIFSPRVEAILQKITTIRELWPGEKIVVVSQFVLFLDIIKEGIERLSKTDPRFKIHLAEYNGAINLEERSRTQYAFNLPTGGPEVLLLSAGAGGVGLNLARGSHMVIAEPPWEPGKMDQVIGRTYRLPQEKEVHVWHMIAHPSEIDQFVLDRQARKTHFVRHLLAAVTGEADTKAIDINEKALPTHTVYEWAKGRAKDIAENECINEALEEWTSTL
ncbi:global transactivator [Fusarium tjaetaba]|uniref:Global transactivator n=1 Tax=Fusarium tjaetaba TaxID=1567544 RepID=A0A8H5QPB9_9HYPO|nr:global transactivator [Fusarium tjaetaba]KAF5620395.1 global transactivator [Fusarium tjaetaba]